VVHLGVNMAVLDAINELSHQLEAGMIDRQGARKALGWIGRLHHDYHPWSVVAAVGAACAAFSQLFGGDAAAAALTFSAAAAAMRARQLLQRANFNPLVNVTITAFTASLIAGGGVRLGVTAVPEAALAASVLLLVPGVHLINAMRDLLMGHMVTGIVRGVAGALVSACIAVGVLIALGIWGVRGF
jgi:uncharacterized membrane protein YjjP (DUF1212 family)